MRMGWLSARWGSGVLALGCLVLIGLLVRLSGTCDRQAAEQASRFTNLYTKAKALEKTAAECRQRADSLSRHIAGLSPHAIHPLVVHRLRKRGLHDPVTDLVDDLASHPELIPIEGVLGGRMAFQDVDRIRVMSESWVYAPFSDGHISGEAIYAYQVAEDGDISWRLVAFRGP
jgi:hypothetical protein